ncbi:hypothetical protein OU415_06060 [Saccharopolyspora sp. WRP15-2]|uniref:Excreted virulence factor EspC (Type VII ESX diderm) n=1 Tax=Saccharopolyspora oryzae TaxID=2997343 RepID=A0ABT4UTD1_9PSEU|nr:hypothetical protein [Saccharopolyspora oryzae]MDA3624989.1 hypothetical protein [Saccharopolyspora oryzae]
MGGYKAQPDAITSCGNNVGGLSSEANSIKEKAAAADVPAVSWGALGAMILRSDYTELYQAFMQHLDEMVTGLTKAGEDISECGKDYQNVDRELAEKLKQIRVDAGSQY